jgi:hypothetical protein
MSVKDLHDWYVLWCDSSGLQPLTGTLFGRELTRLRFETVKSKKAMVDWVLASSNHRLRQIAVIHPSDRTRLVRQHRFDGHPLMMGEFGAHDSKPQF